MSISFVAELRKLTERAEEERRREEAKVRAEQLRVKREAAAEVRAEARRIQRVAMEEQRKKVQEAEQERKLQIAKKRECQRRIREDKAQRAFRERQLRDQEAERKKEIREVQARRALEDKKRREAEERVQRYQAKLIKRCRKIYIELAVAAWDGHREVQIKQDVAEFDEDLLLYGIEVRRPREFVDALDRGMVNILASMEVLSQAIDFCQAIDINYFKHASQNLIRASTELRGAGHFGLSTSLTGMIAAIQVQLPKILQSIEQQRDHAATTIGWIEADCSRSLKEILTLGQTIEAAKNDRLRRESEYGGAIEKIRDHIDDIASAFRANLPQQLDPNKVSYGAKAGALRLAFSAFIPTLNLCHLTDLETINLMRIANRLKPISPSSNSKPGVPSWIEHEVGDLYEGIDLHSKINQLKNGLYDAGVRAKELKVSIVSLERKKRSVTDIQRKLDACLSDAENFEKTIARGLENVTRKNVIFAKDRYIASGYAILRDICPVKSSGIAAAYHELIWLYSEAGRDFCEYLDIVLSELAKKGTRMVVLSYMYTAEAGKVEVGNIALLCEIGHELLYVLFAERGFNVEFLDEAPIRVTLELSW